MASMDLAPMRKEGINSKKSHIRKGLSFESLIAAKSGISSIIFWGLKIAQQENLCHIKGHILGKDKPNGHAFGGSIAFESEKSKQNGKVIRSRRTNPRQ